MFATAKTQPAIDDPIDPPELGYTQTMWPARGVAGPRSEAAEFGDLVRPHWAEMARLCRRTCGPAWEDVLQNALVLAWRKRAAFDPGRGTPRAWLITLTTDQVRKHLRRPRPETPAGDEPVVLVSDRDARLDLVAAIDRLTARQRLTVELYYFLDLPVAEIAAALRCSPGTVKSTLSDARALLRADLGSDYA